MSNQTTDWLSIREAALVLGVSDLTVRRRIKDGRIAHRLVDGKYYVNLTESGPASRHPGEGRNGGDQSDDQLTNHLTDQGAGDQVLTMVTDHSETEDVAVPTLAGIRVDLDAVLSEHARLAEQAGRAAVLEAQVRELSRHQHELEELMLTLSNRNGWLESKLEERERHIKLLTDNSASHGRPWWKRLFRPAPAEA